MNYHHFGFIYAEPVDSDEIEYEADRRTPPESDFYGIRIILNCARIDCDAQETFAATEEDITNSSSTADVQFLVTYLSKGWGYDRHGGNDAALHCPNHRQPPTVAEIKAVNERLEGTNLVADDSDDAAA